MGGAAVGDLDEATTVLIGQGALAGFAVLDRRAPAMVQRNLQPGSRCTLHHKDLGILTAAARDAGVVIPLGAVAAS